MSKAHLPTSAVFIRFLGEAASSGAAGALLGLPSGQATEEQIATALRRQLARVDAHPRAFTAEAEGVRQALRDAAIALMKSGGAVELPWRGPSATGGPEDAPQDRSERRAARAASVDWESYTPKRKLDPAIVVGGVVFIIVFAVVGLTVIWGTSTPPAATPTAPPPAPVAAAPAPAATSTQTAQVPTFTPTAAPLAPTDPTLALRQLRGAAGKIKAGEATATAEFALALAWLGDNWVRLDVGQRRAADDAIVEYLYAAGSREEAWQGVLGALDDAIDPLTSDVVVSADRVWPAAFAAGVLQRLSREREFPAKYANDMARLHIAALGEDRPRQSATFEAGAGAALRRLTPRILARSAAAAKTAPLEVDVQADAQRLVDALARWTEAVAASGLDVPAQEQLLADAIEGLMVRGEPEADRGVFAGVQQLALALKWRAEGSARGRLLGWFDDARLTSADLSVLTTVLATKSGAEGVDATMALSAGASPMDRQTLRERYAAAWGAGAATARLDAGDWYQFARYREAEANSSTLPDDFSETAVLAFANQSARLLWAGDRSAAAASLKKAETFSQVSRQQTSGVQVQLYSAEPEAGGGAWALSYLALGRHIGNRIAKLGELERNSSAPIGVDAAVLADEACFGSPPEVRGKAQAVVIKYASDPGVVKAVLDALPRMGASESASRLIQGLTGRPMPKANHPEWALHARRALVATLVDEFAADAEQASIDDGATAIAEAYSDALVSVDPAAPVASGATPAASEDKADRAVAALWDGMIDKARAQSPNPGAHASLETIEARRRARRSLAAGPVQRWAAEQAAVCDLLAYVTAAERPAMKPRIRAVMDELAGKRRSAESVARQIRSTERAMMLLWVIRLNADGGGVS